MAKRVLGELGYTVLTASDGLEALEVLGRHAGDVQLLITDVIMPKMSGRELAARVTALRPDIRVLYSSGYAADAIGEDGVLGDGINFLAKPYLPSRLADAVREVLDELIRAGGRVSLYGSCSARNEVAGAGFQLPVLFDLGEEDRDDLGVELRADAALELAAGDRRAAAPCGTRGRRSWRRRRRRWRRCGR